MPPTERLFDILLHNMMERLQNPIQMQLSDVPSVLGSNFGRLSHRHLTDLARITNRSDLGALSDGQVRVIALKRRLDYD